MNLPDEKQASSLRRYFYEYVVIGLCFAVVTLFYLYYDLNKTIMREVQDNGKTMMLIIQKNTDVLETIKYK